jgi:hypothetical protein
LVCIVDNFSTVRGYNLRHETALIVNRKEDNMFIIIASVLLLLFLALAGADLLVSNINSDELSNMGVEEKS